MAVNEKRGRPGDCTVPLLDSTGDKPDFVLIAAQESPFFAEHKGEGLGALEGGDWHCSFFDPVAWERDLDSEVV